MPLRAEEAKELSCPGCGSRFRITPRQGRRLPAAVPCPTCDTRMPVERPASDRFWVSRSYAEIFHRNPALAAPVAEQREEFEGPEEGADETFDETADERSGRGIERTSREFEDVSEVRRSRESMFDFGDEESDAGLPDVSVTEESVESEEEADEEVEEFDELEREAPSADLDEFERELSFIAAEAAENVTGTPLPLPVEQPSAPTIETEAPAAESREPEETDEELADEDSEPPPIPKEETDPAATAEAPMPAEELFEEFEEGEDGEPDVVYDVRVEDTVKTEIGVRRLVEMLKEGVWTGAVEIREEGEWVPMRDHAVFERLKNYLVGQSRQILLSEEERREDVDGNEQAEPAAGTESEGGDDPDVEGEEEADAPDESLLELTDTVATSEMPGAQPRGPDREPRVIPDLDEVSDSDSGADGRDTSGMTQAVVGLVVLAAILVGSLLFKRSLSNREAEGSSARSSATSVVATEDTGTSDGSTRAEMASIDTSVPREDTGGTRAAPAIGAARGAVRRALAPKRHARGYLDGGHVAAARRMVVRAMVEEGVASELQEMFTATIERDDSLNAETVTLGVDESIETIRALGGGWSISFRLTQGGESAYAFKPAQKHWKEGWRAEIAAYRLCRIIACHFTVPRNRPARISKKRFKRLYGKVEDEDQEAYRRRFDDLMWKTEEGPDGKEREYLYGTIKDWVPSFAKWPIEYEDVWRPWLEAGGEEALLEQPLSKALAPLAELGQENFHENILEQRGGATTRSIARQLSTILVFDFLVSNWDRFSTAESYYGVNNQFRDGHFVSIDNGAAFPAHHFRVVARRLEPVTRFSRSTVASVRALRPEVVDPVLFPDPSSKERSRLEVFWRQRDRFLDLVNGMVAEYGRQRVLYFE